MVVSVIIPVYNVEAYLPRCINSILSQTYTDLEIWLVNDGSSDKCGQICDMYAEKDSRIKVIHKENGGLSDARNTALNVMTGKWVTFIDSDDYVSPTHIESLLMLAIKNKSEIGIHSLSRFLHTAPPVPNFNSPVEVYTSSEALQNLFYQRKFDTAACGKIYDSSLFKNIRYPKGLLYEDLATTYRLIMASQCIAFSDVKSYYYYTRSNSIENSSFSLKKLNSCLSIIHQLQYEIKEHPYLKSSIQCRIVSFAFHILLEMPSQHPMINKLETIIQKYRFSVIQNNKESSKTRIASLLSYFGTPTIQKLYHLFSIISKRFYIR